MIARATIACAVVALAVSAAGADAVVGQNAFVGSCPSESPPEIYSVGADGSLRTNLTRNTAFDAGPAVSPDGSRIAFISRRDGYEAVYLMNVDGSGQRRLVERLSTAAYGLTAPVWSPRGDRLAFTATFPQEGSFFSETAQYVVGLPSGRPRVLARGICASRGSFSHDGRFLAYQVGPCRFARAEVKVVPVDGGIARTAARGWFAGWAPRSNRLLFLRSTRNPTIAYVATVDAFGRNRWVLGGVPARSAAWAPRGGLVAFTRGGRRPGLYLVRPGTNRSRRLVALGPASGVKWSPNGAWLILTTFRAAPEQRLVTYFVGSDGGRLTAVPHAGSVPVWSRSSRHFAFIGLDGAARVVTPPEPAAAAVAGPPLDAGVVQVNWAPAERVVFAGCVARSSYAATPAKRGMISLP